MKVLLFIPELTILIGALWLFFVSVGKPAPGSARIHALGWSWLVLVACVISLGVEGSLFYGAYKVDLFSQLLKLIIAAGLLVVLLFGRELKGIAHDVRPEYYMFLLLSTAGLLMLVSSIELLTLFLALELSSYCLYLLVPMRDERAGIRVQMESAIKYILFGVLATGVMLFGMSYLFGLTGTTYLPELVVKLSGMLDNPVAIAGIAMFMGGFFFKLAVFPFHFWVPDVYQGASNETTAFLASVPKVAAVALLIRIATLAAPEGKVIVTLMVVLSVLSMFYGNLIALVQTDIKRMLGFSGIAHAGYVLLGILTLKDSGFAVSLYYIVGYLLMNLACFLVICKVSGEGENLAIEDLSGLHQRAPLLALTLAVGMFALAGIPPFVGFMGKFMLLASALREGHLMLVILAAINTAISIYYYLSVVRVAYTTPADNRPQVTVDATTAVVSVALVAGIIILGVTPSSAVDLAATALHALR